MHGGVAHPHRHRRRGAVLILAILVTISGVAAFVWVNGGLPGKAFSRKAPPPDPRAGTPAADAGKRTAATVVQHGERPEASAKTARAGLPVASRKPALRERPQTQAPAARQTVPPAYSEQLKGKRLPAASLPGRPAAAAQPLQRAAADQSARSRAAPTPRRKPADAQTPANPDAYADAEPLARGTLQLQAISWSDNPGARITVIDGRILREGHSVEGYTVIQIRPEDIILGKEGKRWKLGYSRP